MLHEAVALPAVSFDLQFAGFSRQLPSEPTHKNLDYIAISIQIFLVEVIG
jgi:hypothetical protein